MATITSLIDNSASTSPNSSNINVYATGTTPLRLTLSSGEQVTIVGLNGGNPITTSPFNFNYSAGAFPSGLSPVVTSSTPTLAQSVISFGTSTSTSNVVNWTNVPNATSYVVRRSLNIDMSNSTPIYTGALLTFTDTGLTAATTYYYTVTANANGYTSSTSSVSNKSTTATGTFDVTVNITGFGEEYEVYVRLEDESDFILWENHKRAITSGRTITLNVQSADGYAISPSTATVLVNSTKTVEFTASPIATNVTFTGTPTQGEVLTGSYNYTGGTQGNSIRQWYRSDNNSGLNRVAISGANNATYTLQSADVGKFIQYAVTPVNSFGTSGTQVFSSYSSAISASGGSWTAISGTSSPNWVETDGTITVTGNTLVNNTGDYSRARTVLKLANGVSGKIRMSNLKGALIGVSFNQTSLSNTNEFAYYAEHNPVNGKTQCRDVGGGTFDEEYNGNVNGANVEIQFTSTQVIFIIDGAEFGRAVRTSGILTIKTIIPTNTGTVNNIEQQSFTA